MNRLSVVIPALNEADTLPTLLADLSLQQGCELEIIVADGGSDDGTADLARAAGAIVVTSARGRGTQLNAGALAATSDVLLFLHADSHLPDPGTLVRALAQFGAESKGESAAPHIAGHFPIRFDRSKPGHDFLYAWLESKATLGRPGTINGDQGLLLSRDYFRELGGFDARLPFLEDQRIAAKIFESGRWILFADPIITSARRFESEGATPRLSLMALMMGLHAAGHFELLGQLPGIYREQQRTGRLRLKPIHSRVRQALWQSGFRELIRTLWRGGGYVRSNAWQLAFRRDVRRSAHEATRRHPSLDRFDRWIGPWLANPVTDTVATCLLGLWLYVQLPLTEDR